MLQPYQKTLHILFDPRNSATKKTQLETSKGFYENWKAKALLPMIYTLFFDPSIGSGQWSFQHNAKTFKTYSTTGEM